MKKINLLLASVLTLCSCGVKEKAIENTPLEKPVIAGEWVHVFNPNDTRGDIDTTWYTNDHCFAKGPDGRWHGYGIIGHAPINPWTGETQLFHISSDDFANPKWEDHPYALTAQEGKERVLWAPHVFHDKGSDTWQMFYNVGNMQPHAPNYASWGGLCRADSRDMFTWERHPLNPLFSDAGHARDSYLMKVGDIYHFYYTRTVSEVDLRSCIALRTSPDLEHWSGAKVVHTQDYPPNDWGGDAESPYIVKRGDNYYLFICLAMTSYDLTHVYWSKDPTNFPIENFVCELPLHAAEVIEVSPDEWYISNTGWNKKGVYIAPLKWEKL